MNIFELRPDATGGFDFVVDGHFLRARIFQDVDRGGIPISLLRRGITSDELEEQFHRLRGQLPGPFFSDRVWLYFCPECYDEGCGGVSVRIQIETDRVLWSDFRYDSEPDTDDESEFFEEDDMIRGLGPFVFDRTEYEEALSRTAEALDCAFSAFWRNADHLDTVTLGLESLAFRRDKRESKTNEKTRLQWTVDSRPLAQLLQTAANELPKVFRELSSDLNYSVVQPYSVSHIEDGRNTLRMLLGELIWDELPGRVPLLVGECLDIPCGVITTRVRRSGSTVTWSNFAVHGGGAEELFHAYPPELHFTFDSRQHDKTLRRVLESI